MKEEEIASRLPSEKEQYFPQNFVSSIRRFKMAEPSAASQKQERRRNSETITLVVRARNVMFNNLSMPIVGIGSRLCHVQCPWPLNQLEPSSLQNARGRLLHTWQTDCTFC